MCASVFYSVICVEESEFCWISSISSQDCCPLGFYWDRGVYSGLAHFTPGGIIWTRTDYTRVYSRLAQNIPGLNWLGGGVNLGCYTGVTA